MSTTSTTAPAKPDLNREVSRPLLFAFAAYARWYVARRFHSVRLAKDTWQPAPDDPTPTVVYLNHAGWWDPLICLLVWRRSFANSRSFAVIDETALRKYPFFRRLGFVGVAPDSTRGASRFLRLGMGVAHRPHHMLWVTPQGHFADVRERPLRFQAGLGHLAARLANSAPRHALDESQPSPVATTPVRFVPLAIEYTYWHEPRPEALLRWGTPRIIDPRHPSPLSHPQEWSALLEQQLEHTLDRLSALAVARDASAFESLLHGSTGVAGVYDLWRFTKALLLGRTFSARHGQL